MFRYSALTFNEHRIHYDRQYATAIEQYPGLVVHGPLLATLLMELLRANQPDRQARSFSFKGVRPTLVGQRFHVCGKQNAGGNTVSLWILQEDGALAMTATAELN